MTHHEPVNSPAVSKSGAQKPSAKLTWPEWRVVSAAIAAPAILSMMVILSHYCILPLMDEFDVSRGTVMFFLALGVVGQNLLAPFVGRVLMTVAPWKIMFAGVVIISAGLLLGSMAPTFYFIMAAYFVILAIGCTLAAPVANSAALASQAIIARHFPSIMGRAVAAQGVTIAIVSIAVPLVLAPFLTAHGWRMTMAVTGLVVFVYTAPIILLFLRNPGSAVSSIPDAGAASAIDTQSDNARPAAPTTREILTSSKFWLLLLALEPLALSLSGIAPNIVPFFHDKGVSLDEAKYTLAALAASSAVGAVIAGFVVDRTGPWIYLTVVSIGCFLGVSALSLDLWDPAISFIVLILSISGLGATLIVAISRMFGASAFAPVMGLLTPFMMGSAFAGAFTGWMRDRLGSYQIVFGFMAAMLLISVFAALYLLVANRNERRAAAASR